MPVTAQITQTVVLPEPDEVIVQTPGGGETIVVNYVRESLPADTAASNCDLAITQVQEVVNIPAGDEMIVIQSAGPQGATGPQGPSGGDEEVPYAKRIDWVSDLVLYKGEAVVGAAEGASVWRIQRITLGTDDDVTVEWADGVSDFTKVWTNRLSYTYS